MKEKLNSLVEDTEESIVNQNGFRVLSILHITNFCETRKRGWALNNQGQKLFQLGCAINYDISDIVQNYFRQTLKNI